MQALIDSHNSLSLAKMQAEADCAKKKTEVARLYEAKKTSQAWQSMQTAKQHQARAERFHAMVEQVERIKATLIAQQNVNAIFSAFVQADSALAAMLRETPLEKVEDVLDTLQERMYQGDEVGQALAGNSVEFDDDEIAAFLGQSSSSGSMEAATTSLSSPPTAAKASGDVTKQTPAPVRMLAME